MKYKFLFFFLFLFIFIKGYHFKYKYSEDSENNEYIVFIESLKSVDESKVSYYIKILGTQDKFILNIYKSEYEKNPLNLSLYSSYKYGDVVKLKGKISIPEKLNNPGEFNYKLYLYSNNIHGLIVTYNPVNEVKYELNFIEKILKNIYYFKEKTGKIIQDTMDEENSQIAMAIIYGERFGLDEQLQNNFENIGVSHLMSISGTHIISFLVVINVFLGNSKKSKNILKELIKIIAVIIYIIFTGFSISVLRAGIMAIIGIIYGVVKKKKDNYKVLILTALIILCYNPYAIFNVGAQLSFMASLGIFMFKNYIFQMLKYKIPNLKNEMLKKIVSKIVESISITLAVQLVIFPIQLSAFNKIQFPIIISNLLVGMISVPIRVLGTIGILGTILPSFSLKFFSFIEIIVILLVKLVNGLNRISFGISSVSLSPIFYIFYYILILSIYLGFKIKNIIKLNFKKYNFNAIFKKLKKFQILLGIFLLIFLIYSNIYSIYYSKYVYFFNVEQGDMSYIKCGNESVIVDIGSMKDKKAFNVISNYFKMSNLEHVDLIVISHMHKDHINGLENFLKEYDVGLIVYAKPYEITKQYLEFKTILENNNVKFKEVKAGESIKLKNITIDILLPKEEHITTSDGINENSLVCNVKVNNKNILYMGDAGKIAEDVLLSEKLKLKEIYILKIGHHGSKTATSEQFITSIKPYIAVISANKKYYGHPHEQVLEILKNNKVYTYLTEEKGAIKFSLN